MEISASLVLYKNDPNIVRRAVVSVLDTPLKVNLVIVDNSPTPELSTTFDNLKNFEIEYFYNQGNNVGFGKAHNLAISKAKNCDYHLVINPDIYFAGNVILKLIKYLEENQDVGLISPKTCLPDGEIIPSVRRYPTVMGLARNFIPKNLRFLFKKKIDLYEMRDSGYDQIMEVPAVGGSFMLFRRKCLDEIGYFDENIFLFLEDFDISWRIFKSGKYKNIFYPHVHIYHLWERGYYKSPKLAIITVRSAIYFFSKHGWRLF
ncbi:MAG: glycosyltransferase [Microcystis aeruginosa L311-01]|nr:glycosyltransferase [Microcystis aeruginosa L311-01]